MKTYAVSVIIPAFNAEKYISRCLNSLIMQKGIEVEIVIVNDGSTDNTEKICKEFLEKYDSVTIISKENEGQGIARNVGIEHASGEYIGFVDADDYVEPNMFRCLYDYAKETKSDWSYSYMEGETFLKSDFVKQYKDCVIADTAKAKSYIKSLLLGGLPTDKYDSFLGMSVCRSIFRRTIIMKYNLRFVSERLVNSEDLLFNLDYLNRCDRICMVNKIFYHYCHDNPCSFSLKQNSKRYFMFKELYAKLLEYSENQEEKLRASRRFLANIRVTIVEKSRWCGIKNFKNTEKEIREILEDQQLLQVLETYPISKLPWMQKSYFYLMKYKLVLLLIIVAKLRYFILQ